MRHVAFVLILLVASLLSACGTPAGNTVTQQPVEDSGRQIFQNNCVACHGFQGEGASLMLRGTGIAFNNPKWQKKYSDKQLITIIQNGRGSMPSFHFLPEEEKALIHHVRSLSK